MAVTGHTHHYLRELSEDEPWLYEALVEASAAVLTARLLGGSDAD